MELFSPAKVAQPKRSQALQIRMGSTYNSRQSRRHMPRGGKQERARSAFSLDLRTL